MKIKVLKTQTASKDKTGCYSFEYHAGSTYDIYDDLANVFIKNGWGEKSNINTSTPSVDVEVVSEIQDDVKEESNKQSKRGKKKK